MPHSTTSDLDATRRPHDTTPALARCACDLSCHSPMLDLFSTNVLYTTAEEGYEPLPKYELATANLRKQSGSRDRGIDHDARRHCIPNDRSQQSQDSKDAAHGSQRSAAAWTSHPQQLTNMPLSTIPNQRRYNPQQTHSISAPAEDRHLA